MFVFASSLELVDDMMRNIMVRHHANQVIKILDKIVILLTKSSISEQDKITLFELGKDHYHFGLKKEHFQVFYYIKYSITNLILFNTFLKQIFENCFIESLGEILDVSNFQDKFENPWRKLIQFLFKQYSDGMNFEKKEEIKSEKYNL